MTDIDLDSIHDLLSAANVRAKEHIQDNLARLDQRVRELIERTSILGRIHEHLTAAGVPLFDSIVDDAARLRPRVKALIDGHVQKAKEAENRELEDLRKLRWAVIRKITNLTPVPDFDEAGILKGLDELLSSDPVKLSRELEATKAWLEEAREKAHKYDQIRRLLDIPND